jgi:hypothetical protein
MYGQISGHQVAEVAYQAGWRGENLMLAVAHAYAESRFIPTAYGQAYNTYGLWQVEGSHYNGDPNNLFNPQVNADVAYKVWEQQGWSGWQDNWYAYTDIAIKAVASLSQDGAYAKIPAWIKGVQYPAIVVPVHTNSGISYTTYLLYTVLKPLGYSNKFLGDATFEVDGKTVEGIAYEGQTYLPWSSLPGLKAFKNQRGGFTFERTSKAAYFSAFIAGAAVGVGS